MSVHGTKPLPPGPNNSPSPSSSPLGSPSLASHSDVSNWKLVGRLLKLTWRYRAGCVNVLVLNITLLILGLIGLGLVGVGLDVVRHAAVPKTPPVRWPFGWEPPAHWDPMLLITLIAGGVLLSAALRSLLRWAATLATADLVQRKLVVGLRTQVYDRLQRLSFRFFDANNSGSIINRVTGDTNALANFVNNVVVQSMTLILSLTLYFIYMVAINLKLTLACLITTPVLLILTVWFSQAVKPAYRINRELVDKLINTLSESIQGIHVIKGFATQDQQKAQFERDNAAVRDQNQWIFWRVTIFQPVIGVLTHVNLAILLCYGGYLYMQGELAFGSGLVVFAGLLNQFSNQIASIAQISNTVQASLTASARVFEVIDAPIEIASPANPTPLPVAKGRLTFENVSFGYKDDEPVLSELNFDIPPGACVAIVGSTGAGKSTLLSLIPRFYDPMQGRVLLDGHDLKDLDVDELRRHIGLVFQESFLFSNSVAANISFGNPQATREQIIAAAKIAAADDFISELPYGYDTVIGEHGSDLSGGQRQRLAIARAILLEPAVLILDDATAAIDPQTEHEILAAMDNAMEGRTTFVVAHRLSTLRRSDMVLVLEKGRIVQVGTHEQLMSVGGHYRKAARLQLGDDESKRLLGLSADHDGSIPS